MSSLRKYSLEAGISYYRRGVSLRRHNNQLIELAISGWVAHAVTACSGSSPFREKYSATPCFAPARV